MIILLFFNFANLNIDQAINDDSGNGSDNCNDNGSCNGNDNLHRGNNSRRAILDNIRHASLGNIPRAIPDNNHHDNNHHNKDDWLHKYQVLHKHLHKQDMHMQQTR
jgi:hypothetical protein